MLVSTSTVNLKKIKQARSVISDYIRPVSQFYPLTTELEKKVHDSFQ